MSDPSSTKVPSPEDTSASAEPVNAPGRETMDVAHRAGADSDTGGTTSLTWSARSDVGLVRGHNEDSFLVRAPLFCVCDGMGGHAAGEVASSIAVRTISAHAPLRIDDALLGAALEAANTAIIDGAATGKGKPGMGCTATAVYIDGAKMAVAHVGDSRVYILHAGTLVRVTHDHSYVEELVDAGEITADEARVHPSRSIITRALGNDPDMYADHFTLDVERGDRVIICSDGLSSMIPDSEIEGIASSSTTPQAATDNLVGAALTEGGHDNVTVIVVDVTDDGLEEARRRVRVRAVVGWIAGLAAILAALGCGVALFVSNSWYVGNNLGTVGIYQGVDAKLLGIDLSHLEESTSVQTSDLPEATQKQLSGGIRVSSLDEAEATVESYRDQINADKAKAVETADSAQAQSAATSPASETTDGEGSGE